MSWNILRGIGGDFEITRVLGASGVAVYIVAANVFEAWTVWGQGKPFDITAYCLAFPTGLGAAIAAVSTAAGFKDKAVATAQVVRDTGSQPGSAAPAPTAAPAKVQVVNEPDSPVPVKEKS